MANTITNPYRDFKSVNYSNPLEEIKNYVGKNGLVPFEHGYKNPRFKFHGAVYECSMIGDTIVYCMKLVSFNGKTTRKTSSVLLEELTKTQLNKLLNEMKKYELYCRYEA